MELSSRCTAEGPTAGGGRDSERDRALLSPRDQTEQEGEKRSEWYESEATGKTRYAHNRGCLEEVCPPPISGEDTLCTLKGEILVLSGFRLQKTFE